MSKSSCQVTPHSLTARTGYSRGLAVPSRPNRVSCCCPSAQSFRQRPDREARVPSWVSRTSVQCTPRQPPRRGGARTAAGKLSLLQTVFRGRHCKHRCGLGLRRRSSVLGSEGECEVTDQPARKDGSHGWPSERMSKETWQPLSSGHSSFGCWREQLQPTQKANSVQHSLVGFCIGGQDGDYVGETPTPVGPASAEKESPPRGTEGELA